MKKKKLNIYSYKRKKNVLFINIAGIDTKLNASTEFKCNNKETVLRWWRNRKGRPLFPQQINQKNI